MGWTAPRTWVHEEVVTAAIMNAHVRDNMVVLETPRDSSGRVTNLSSATFANLSAANLTGLADPAANNDFTAGRHRFNQGAGTRFVVPVGADKWAGTKGVDARGIWVEGNYLHHISSNHTTEWRYLGTGIANRPGAVPGSVWVNGDYLHYICTNSDERRCESKGTTGHSDAGSLGGSAWAETYAHIVRESGTVEKPLHADVTHSDHTDHNDHNDHDDSGTHVDHDDHDDVTHNPHEDQINHDDHLDYIASEWVHEDYDDHADHTDYTDHDDHDDSGPHDDHNDHNDSTPHNDIDADNRPVVV